MLKALSIRNFAIIDDLSINFSPGLTVLSGETGAGKSIIINAVNLLLGARASSRMIRSGAQSAELEALFQFKPASQLSKRLKKHGYDSSDELLIRRIISESDRHRIYINGRLATIQLLNTLTENLASISGQHAHQGLLKEDQQLLLLDQFGALTALRQQVNQLHREVSTLIQTLTALKEKRKRQSEHIELIRFQRKEIFAADVSPGEDEILEKERNLLKNAAVIYQSVHESIDTLYSSQGAIVERLTEVSKKLEKTAQIDSTLSEITNSLAEISFNLEDKAAELRRYLQTLQTDEMRLEEVESRIDTLQKLKRKYGGSVSSILAHAETIDLELSEIENISEKIDTTAERLTKLHDKLIRLVQKLSRKRKAAAVQFTRAVERELATLKMDDTKFEISFLSATKNSPADPYLSVDGKAVGESGIDCITFMIAPNVGEALKPLSNIASGGELSRIVLALKAILAKIESVETVVFDEVDAGIGGGVAEVVGKKLSSLAKFHQIICITHLPQIAKFGNQHFRISKQVENNRTRTTILPLTREDRVKEIARMLGGVNITQATLDHAAEMLQR